MGNGSPRVRKSSRSNKLKRSEQPKMIETATAAFYRQVNPALKQQMADSRMIQEDEYAIANLSGNPIVKQFNPNRFMESLGFRDECNEVG